MPIDVKVIISERYCMLWVIKAHLNWPSVCWNFSVLFWSPADVRCLSVNPISHFWFILLTKLVTKMIEIDSSFFINDHERPGLPKIGNNSELIKKQKNIYNTKLPWKNCSNEDVALVVNFKKKVFSLRKHV